MDMLGISELMGYERLEDSSPTKVGDTVTYYGTATSDSANGTVSVWISDDVLQPDESLGTSVEMACSCSVKKGDTVMITLVLVGNSMRVPTVTSVVGGGSRFGDLTADSVSVGGHALDFRNFGTNPVKTTATDTQATWAELGTGLSYYNATGQLNGQPSRYGLMLNMTNGYDVGQIWKEQRDGGLYIRGANSAQGFAGWHLIPYVMVFYAASGKATITLPKDTRHLIISSHNSTPELNGIALVTGSTVWKLAGGSYITYSHSGTTVTATSTQGGNPAYYLIPLE